MPKRVQKQMLLFHIFQEGHNIPTCSMFMPEEEAQGQMNVHHATVISPSFKPFKTRSYTHNCLPTDAPSEHMQESSNGERAPHEGACHCQQAS